MDLELTRRSSLHGAVDQTQTDTHELLSMRSNQLVKYKCMVMVRLLYCDPNSLHKKRPTSDGAKRRPVA